MAGIAQLINPSSIIVILLPLDAGLIPDVLGTPITNSLLSAIRLDLMTTCGVSVLLLCNRLKESDICFNILLTRCDFPLPRLPVIKMCFLPVILKNVITASASK